MWPDNRGISGSSNSMITIDDFISRNDKTLDEAKYRFLIYTVFTLWSSWYIKTDPYNEFFHFYKCLTFMIM